MGKEKKRKRLAQGPHVLLFYNLFFQILDFNSHLSFTLVLIGIIASFVFYIYLAPKQRVKINFFLTRKIKQLPFMSIRRTLPDSSPLPSCRFPGPSSSILWGEGWMEDSDWVDRISMKTTTEGVLLARNKGHKERGIWAKAMLKRGGFMKGFETSGTWGSAAIGIFNIGPATCSLYGLQQGIEPL